MVFPLDKDDKKYKIKESDLIPKKRDEGYKVLMEMLKNNIRILYEYNLTGKINIDTKISKFWSNHRYYDNLICTHILTIIIGLIIYTAIIIHTYNHDSTTKLISIITATIILLVLFFFEIRNLIRNINADNLNFIQTAVYYYNNYTMKISSDVDNQILFNNITNIIVQIKAITEEDNKNG